MATHSSILAWRIPWTEEPGGLQSMRSQRVGHKVMTNTHTHTFRGYLEKEMATTPVFLPGKSVYSYSPWGWKELNMT